LKIVKSCSNSFVHKLSLWDVSFSQHSVAEEEQQEEE